MNIIKQKQFNYTMYFVFIYLMYQIHSLYIMKKKYLILSDS